MAPTKKRGRKVPQIRVPRQKAKSLIRGAKKRMGLIDFAKAVLQEARAETVAREDATARTIRRVVSSK